MVANNVNVNNNQFTVAQYDGRHFRIVKRAAAEDGGASSSSRSSSSSSSSSSGSSVSEARHFYYNNAGQVVEERVDGDCERQYVWGLRYIDDLVLRDRDTDGDGSLEERLYAVQDANWNVVALANAGGAVQERFIYNAYGTPSVLNADFTAKTGGTGSDWEFLFTGRRLDGETGLMYYRNRYYHGVLGRFINRDPAEYEAGDLSLYRYVGGTPTMFVDPRGLNGMEDQLAREQIRRLLDEKEQQRRTEQLQKAREVLETLCACECLECRPERCKEEARQIAEAYVAMFYARKGLWGVLDYNAGWKCYQWQTHTYNALTKIVEKGKCFDIRRVGWVDSSPRGLSIITHTWNPRRYLQHNWVAISAKRPKEFSDLGAAPAGECTVYLDPWMECAPVVYRSDEKSHMLHNLQVKFTHGPDDAPTIGEGILLPTPGQPVTSGEEIETYGWEDWTW